MTLKHKGSGEKHRLHSPFLGLSSPGAADISVSQHFPPRFHDPPSPPSSLSPVHFHQSILKRPYNSFPQYRVGPKYFIWKAGIFSKWRLFRRNQCEQGRILGRVNTLTWGELSCVNGISNLVLASRVIFSIARCSRSDVSDWSLADLTEVTLYAVCEHFRKSAEGWGMGGGYGLI